MQLSPSALRTAGGLLFRYARPHHLQNTNRYGGLRNNNIIRTMPTHHLSSTAVTNQTGTGGLELTFLGTSSQGGARRYPSSLAMRLRATTSSQVWLFDAGEGALSQLQRSSMRISLVTNIFVTHLHGDHLYGLPSIVLSVLRSRAHDPVAAPLDIYGPHGIRAFLRVALGVAGFRCLQRDVLRIHELHWPSDFGSKGRRREHSGAMYWRTSVRRLPYESTGREIRPESDPNQPGQYTYRLVSEPDADDADECSELPATVVAAPVLHTVPTYAFGIDERVGRKRFDKAALAALGVASDGSSRDLFHAWLDGRAAAVDGRQVNVDEVMQDGRAPRRVCVVGDTFDASGAVHIAQDVDVLVHEATNVAAQSKVAKRRGHSSTRGATAFAKRVRAKRLILNHTSVAYSERKIRSMETEARGMFGADRAFVARDLSLFSVPTCEEDCESFVFRQFVGYANSSEYRGPRDEDNPFQRELVVGEDECVAKMEATWDERQEAEEGDDDDDDDDGDYSIYSEDEDVEEENETWGDAEGEVEDSESEVEDAESEGEEDGDESDHAHRRAKCQTIAFSELVRDKAHRATI